MENILPDNNERMFNPQDVAEDIKYTDFNQWLTDRSDEELAYFMNVGEQFESLVNENKPGEQSRKRREIDDDTLLRLHIVSLNFTDKLDWSERNTDAAYNKLMVHVGYEVTRRTGMVTKEGLAALEKRQDTAMFKIADIEEAL